VATHIAKTDKEIIKLENDFMPFLLYYSGH
jgi:hypothetical protein